MVATDALLAQTERLARLRDALDARRAGARPRSTLSASGCWRAAASACPARRPRCAAPRTSTGRASPCGRRRPIARRDRRRPAAGDRRVHRGGGRAAGAGAAPRRAASASCAGPALARPAHRRPARAAVRPRGRARPGRPAGRRAPAMAARPSRADHRPGVRRGGARDGDEPRRRGGLGDGAAARVPSSGSRPPTDSPGSRRARRSRCSAGGSIGLFREGAVSVERVTTSRVTHAPSGTARPAGAGAGERPGPHRALRRSRASRRASSSTSVRPRPSRRSPTDEPWDLTSNVAGGGRARRRVAARDRARDARRGHPRRRRGAVHRVLAGRAHRGPARGVGHVERRRARDLRCSGGRDRAARGPRRDGDPQHRRLHPGPRRTAVRPPPAAGRAAGVRRRAVPIPTAEPAPAHQREAYAATATAVDAAESAAVREQIAAMDAFTADYAQRDGLVDHRDDLPRRARRREAPRPGRSLGRHADGSPTWSSGGSIP